jgi:signal transduction histidine kinase
MLSNAVKFSPNQARIEVAIRRAGLCAAFVVRDYGPGIAAATLNRIGEPFLRIENPNLSSHEGTGLGLSIAVKLAESQGGSFDIRNMEAPERGTCASLWLPLAPNSGACARDETLVAAK